MLGEETVCTHCGLGRGHAVNCVTRIPPGSLAWVAARFDAIWREIQALRGAGQKEYAGGDRAFGNFERLASALDLPRERVLWVYLAKHLDGIQAWLRGHKSQREDVRGRIKDAIVYLLLLHAMVDEAEGARDQPVALLERSAAPWRAYTLFLHTRGPGGGGGLWGCFKTLDEAKARAERQMSGEWEDGPPYDGFPTWLSKHTHGEWWTIREWGDPVPLPTQHGADS